MEALVENTLLNNYNKYYRMAYSYVKNEADAGDIVQEGAYKAIKKCNQLKDESLVETWVYRIMLNEVFALLRSKNKNDFLEDVDEEQSYEDVHEDMDLKQALDSLDEKDQAVIKLKYFEDLKLKEISEIMGENESTIKSRLYRGLKKLRLNLDEQMEV